MITLRPSCIAVYDSLDIFKNRLLGELSAFFHNQATSTPPKEHLITLKTDCEPFNEHFDKDDDIKALWRHVSFHDNEFKSGAAPAINSIAPEIKFFLFNQGKSQFNKGSAMDLVISSHIMISE